MAISVWRQEAAAALLVLFALHVSAEPASTAQPAYDVLQRHGLLPRTVPPTTSSAVAKSQSQPSLHNERVVISSSTASAPVPRPALALVKPAPVSEAASAAEPPPSALTRAYNLLRLKGLLPGVPGSTSTAYVPPGRARHGAERVVVDKSDRRLYLLRGGKPYREYTVSLGGNPKGHKQRAGDLKTPEGTYTLDWRNPRSRFYKSIHISYPNAEDRLRAEQQGVDPGGDIMLHGEHYNGALQRTLRRARLRRDWTEGCIALNNEHIDEIWREVADGTTIEIRP